MLNAESFKNRYTYIFHVIQLLSTTYFTTRKKLIVTKQKFIVILDVNLSRKIINNLKNIKMEFKHDLIYNPLIFYRHLVIPTTGYNLLDCEEIVLLSIQYYM